MLKGIQLTMLAGPGLPVAVPRKVIDALLEVEVTVSTERISGFQLKFRLSQRSPLHTLFLLAGGSLPPVFRVTLIATLNGQAETLINGVVTDIQIHPGSAADDPVLTVTGEDLTRLMDYIDFTGFPYPAMPPEARVAVIVAKYAAFGLRPRIVPAFIRDFDSPLDYVAHHIGTDLCYLKKLAKDVGYRFYLEPGEGGNTTAYWGPEIKVGIPQPALSTNMGVHSNLDSINFTFNNSQAVQPVITIHHPQLKTPIPIPIPDISPLNPPLGIVPLVRNRIKRNVDVAHLSPTKAVLRGIAESSRSGNAISANGTVDVLRYGRMLRPRRLVGVRGVGSAFNGLYYCSDVTSRLSVGSFKQDFVLTRNALVSTLPRIPA